MYGFYNRILVVNLDGSTFAIQPLDPEVPKDFLGGKGLAAHLLTQMNPKGVDPLSPDNRLIFATGPAANSGIWGASRYGVFTKSPQTGLFCQSYAGGHAPEAIDAAGFDAIVISGAAREKTILEIHPGGAVFHPAEETWGMEAPEAETLIRKRFKKEEDRRIGVAVIGPAGENRVCFATIQNDMYHFAGRTGPGAVMGSKGLKAIVFKGDEKRRSADPDRVKALCRKIRDLAKDNPTVHAYKTMGTSMMVKANNNAGSFPTQYWSAGKAPHWEDISADALHNRCTVHPKACARCMMACGRMSVVNQGRHAGMTLKGPEYETIYAFGGLCMVDSIEEVLYLNQVCNRLGLDTITAGNLCAFAVEAARAGRIDLEIDYNNTDAIVALLEQIASRKGLGEVLAKGIRHAAREWDMADRAVHVKGLEPAGFDPRVLKGVGLGYAVSERGACHLRATFHRPELAGLIPMDQIEGKAEMFVDYEERLTLFDTLILCKFFRDIYTWDDLAEMISALTGQEMDKQGLQSKVRKITDLIRSFNLREGMDPEEDTLPRRFFSEPLPGGEIMDKTDFDTMKKAYYGLKHWPESGRTS